MPDAARIGALCGETPGLNFRTFGEPQLAEGNCNLYSISPIVDLSFRFSDRVPGKILISFRLAEIGISLNTQWVDPELESSPLIVESVDHDDHMVVLD